MTRYSLGKRLCILASITAAVGAIACSRGPGCISGTWSNGTLDCKCSADGSSGDIVNGTNVPDCLESVDDHTVCCVYSADHSVCDCLKYVCGAFAPASGSSFVTATACECGESAAYLTLNGDTLVDSCDISVTGGGVCCSSPDGDCGCGLAACDSTDVQVADCSPAALRGLVNLCFAGWAEVSDCLTAVESGGGNPGGGDGGTCPAGSPGNCSGGDSSTCKCGTTCQSACVGCDWYCLRPCTSDSDCAGLSFSPNATCHSCAGSGYCQAPGGYCQ
jgi:hypothetical protein